MLCCDISKIMHIVIHYTLLNAKNTTGGVTMEKLLVYFIVLAFAGLVFPALAASVDVQGKAPDFEAESTMGTIRLSDYLGKKNVLLAFYFKDFTSG